MEIENMTHNEEVIDSVKLEENDNQTQVQIGIENSEEPCVKLEEIEFENNTGNSLYTDNTRLD